MDKQVPSPEKSEGAMHYASPYKDEYASTKD